MAVEPTYQSKKTCPVCEQHFSTTMTRVRLVMIKQDSDFCTYYKELNPNYYAVWVCPHCGYAALDSYFGDIMPISAEKIRDFLKGRDIKADYTGVRTWEQAVATYKLALFFAELIHAPDSRLAALYLRLAWLYREAESAEEEMGALQKACDAYEQALMRERMPVGNMTQLTLEYLVGELLRRTGKEEVALRYFGKVAVDPMGKSEYRIQKMAKEAWQSIRDKRRKEREQQKESE